MGILRRLANPNPNLNPNPSPNLNPKPSPNPNPEPIPNPNPDPIPSPNPEPDDQVEILRRVGSHPNIVALKDVFETEREWLIVMELVTGGDPTDLQPQTHTSLQPRVPRLQTHAPRPPPSLHLQASASS